MRLSPAYILFIIAGLIPLVIYGLSERSQLARILGVGGMVAGAAFLGGVLVGILFGIPRTLQTDEPPGDSLSSRTHVGYRVNTNLEQISDWLTKILVGIGLVQLPDIALAVGRLADAIADAMGGSSGSIVVAGGLLV